MKKQIIISVMFVSVLGIGVLGFTEAKESPDMMSELELSNIYGGCPGEVCELADRCEKDWSPSSELERGLIVLYCAGTIESPCDMEIGGSCGGDPWTPPYLWCSVMYPTPICNGEYTETNYHNIGGIYCATTETTHSCGDRDDCQTEGSG